MGTGMLWSSVAGLQKHASEITCDRGIVEQYCRCAPVRLKHRRLL